ncbi:MAG: alpha/beta hydrolase [Desulfobacterales bacterium]|nr:alpha/beta hydrolase [Desulfobacterales bacterium]
METLSDSDYSCFERPGVLHFLFYPREEMYRNFLPNSTDITIPVDDDENIGATFHLASTSSPTILFFHGNGEIAADYDDLAPFYTDLGINFFPVDYRGYGRSTGKPTVTSMMNDSHKILKFTKQWLKDNKHTGPLIIMGRSLGSASAIEIAANHENEIDGLIIESGFAFVVPLLKLLGVNTKDFELVEEKGFKHIEKIKKYKKPLLVIHAAFDHIIPFSDGEALFATSPSEKKFFLKVPKANHNNLLAYAFSEYMDNVQNLIKEATNQ